MFIGTGTTVTLDAGAVAEILDVTPPGMSRESIQSSHMGTTAAHTFLFGKLYDGGELVLEIAFAPDYELPFSSGDSTVAVIITFPDATSGTTWSFAAGFTGYEAGDPLEDRATATVTLKVTGEIAIA